MRNTKLIIGIISLVLATIIFLLDINKIVTIFADRKVNIYPSIFFLIMGVVLILNSRKR